MASVIKAGNATDGVQVTSDNTGILELKTGTGAGTTAMTIGTDQSVTFAATPIYSGGTANTVVYLNASKAMTANTGLAYDGTTFRIGSNLSRAAYFSSLGIPTFRYDDNATVQSIKLNNRGITSTGHGVAIAAFLSTDGINEYNAGGIGFQATNSYSSTASTQDSNFFVQVAVDGVNTTVATFTTAGNIAMGQADKGIDFSVNSAAAGATSEVLNDYEEGTWTPTILYGGADTGQTYVIQVGRYVKVGDIVHAQGFAQVNVTASSTGTMSMGGLPFAIANVTNYGPACAASMDNASSALDQPSGIGVTNATQVNILSGTGANNATALTDAARGASFRLRVSITYRVS